MKNDVFTFQSAVVNEESIFFVTMTGIVQKELNGKAYVKPLLWLNDRRACATATTTCKHIAFSFGN